MPACRSPGFPAAPSRATAPRTYRSAGASRQPRPLCATTSIASMASRAPLVEDPLPVRRPNKRCAKQKHRQDLCLRKQPGLSHHATAPSPGPVRDPVCIKPSRILKIPGNRSSQGRLASARIVWHWPRSPRHPARERQVRRNGSTKPPGRSGPAHREHLMFLRSRSHQQHLALAFACLECDSAVAHRPR